MPRAGPPAIASAAPKIGFVSLGCPKALTDSELILTRSSAEGYATSKTLRRRRPRHRQHLRLHRRRRARSLDTIGEALAANGKVVVTGCLGAKAGRGRRQPRSPDAPSVLAVTGPHATEEVMDAVHAHVPKPHDPFVDLVPAPPVDRHQADAEALRLPQDQRGLQPPLHRSASSRACAATWSRGRSATSSPRRRRCSSRASRSCSSSARTPSAVRRSTSAIAPASGTAGPVKTQLLSLCEQLAEIAGAPRRLGAPALRLSRTRTSTRSCR
jgi:hypothetical protein